MLLSVGPVVDLSRSSQLEECLSQSLQSLTRVSSTPVAAVAPLTNQGTSQSHGNLTNNNPFRCGMGKWHWLVFRLPSRTRIFPTPVQVFHQHQLDRTQSTLPKAKPPLYQMKIDFAQINQASQSITILAKIYGNEENLEIHDFNCLNDWWCKSVSYAN